MTIIERVVNDCKVCQKFQKSIAHPRVTLPKTTSFNEVVRVVWNNDEIDQSDLLKLFWECHDPTQGNRQGNDCGSQYRSAIYTTNENQLTKAIDSKNSYQKGTKVELGILRNDELLNVSLIRDRIETPRFLQI